MSASDDIENAVTNGVQWRSMLVEGLLVPQPQLVRVNNDPLQDVDGGGIIWSRSSFDEDQKGNKYLMK